LRQLTHRPARVPGSRATANAKQLLWNQCGGSLGKNITDFSLFSALVRFLTGRVDSSGDPNEQAHPVVNGIHRGEVVHGTIYAGGHITIISGTGSAHHQPATPHLTEIDLISSGATVNKRTFLNLLSAAIVKPTPESSTGSVGRKGWNTAVMNKTFAQRQIFEHECQDKV
jgi:hypothetical protein